MILLLTAGLAVSAARGFRWDDDAGRIAGALGGGALGVGAGLLAAVAGPAALGGDTSLDAFLRRTGRWGALRESYLDRFRLNWRKYAPIMTPPLMVMGSLQTKGFARRFLVMWALVTVVLVPVGLVAEWFPPDRAVTFAFCIPLLAASGLVWLGRRIGRAMFAVPICLGVGVLIALPPLRTWADVTTYLSPDEIVGAGLAGRIAATTPPGTQLVFIADGSTDRALFLLSHALNVGRSVVPPERAVDVRVFVGTAADLLAERATVRGHDLFDLASRTSLGDIALDRPFEVFVVRELDRGDPALTGAGGLTPWSGSVASTVGDVRALPDDPTQPRPSTGDEMAAATTRTLILLVMLGLGWGWWAMRDLASGLAIAAAFGLAMLTVVAFVLERLGAPFASPGWAMTAAVLAGGGGYAALVIGLGVRDHDDVGPRLVVEGEPPIDPAS